MNRDAASRISRPRRYHSPLRQRHADDTRRRILDAYAEQLTDASLSDFSIERVAARAGVSTATVYRHFPNREALLAGLQSWLDSLHPDLPVPTAADDLPQRVAVLFRDFDRSADFIRAGLKARISESLRSAGRAQRRELIESLVRGISDQLTGDEIRNAAAVLHYLIGTQAWDSLHTESGMTGAEASEAVAWAVRTLVAELKRQAAARAGDAPECEGGTP